MISINWLCWTCVILGSCPKFNLEGRQLTSASKLKPVAFVFGLGPNVCLSLGVGGVILEDVTSTCSNWTMIVSGATGNYYISMLSPFISILDLCSIWWHSMVNNSVANKGFHIQTFCFEVFIRMTGTLLVIVVVTHLFITMPRGRLWCLACSTRHAIFDGILVHPKTVVTKFPWTQIGFFWASSDLSYESISSKILFVVFYRQVICLWGFGLSNLLGHDFRCCSQSLVLLYVWMVKDAQLGK